MKTLFAYLSLAGFLAFTVYASLSLAPRGEVDAPLHRSESAAGSAAASHYYISSAFQDAHTDNMVTVVLGDYRAYDTLGEVLVVFTAGVCAMLLLRRFK